MQECADAIVAGAPRLLSAMLAVRYGPALASSPLLQGDIPGHLETMRWYAEHVWPLPWGWDPRWLLGTPVGILYPPLFHWLGGGLGKLVGVDVAMKLLIFVAVVALPPALAAAARGFGLRAREAALAAAAGLCVLWIPGQGLGGTLRQTFVAGNVANAFALPFFLLLVATLRRGLLRPSRWALPALLLASCLLTHFLVGAVAGITVVGFALATRRWARGSLIAGLGLLGAMPFLVPFAVHFRDGSPDVISHAPPPFLAEWIALAALHLLTRRSRTLRPVFLMLLALYLAARRAPRHGGAPVPDGVAAVPALPLPRARSRGLPPGAALPEAAAWLPSPSSRSSRSSSPTPRAGRSRAAPPDLPDLKGERVLVLASPRLAERFVARAAVRDPAGDERAGGEGAVRGGGAIREVGIRDRAGLLHPEVEAALVGDPDRSRGRAGKGARAASSARDHRDRRPRRERACRFGEPRILGGRIPAVAGSSMRRLKGLALNLLLVALSIGLAFGALEIVLRVTDLDRGDWYAAGPERVTFLREHVKKNADGFRDRDFPRERRRGRQRILAVGDSFTFGDGIEDVAKTWPKVLEASLRSRGPARRVFNLGIPGTNTAFQRRSSTPSAGR